MSIDYINRCRSRILKAEKIDNIPTVGGYTFETGDLCTKMYKTNSIGNRYCVDFENVTVPLNLEEQKEVYTLMSKKYHKIEDEKRKKHKADTLNRL